MPFHVDQTNGARVYSLCQSTHFSFFFCSATLKLDAGSCAAGSAHHVCTATCALLLKRGAPERLQGDGAQAQERAHLHAPQLSGTSTSQPASPCTAIRTSSLRQQLLCNMMEICSFNVTLSLLIPPMFSVAASAGLATLFYIFSKELKVLVTYVLQFLKSLQIKLFRLPV